MSRIGNKINSGYVATQLPQAKYMRELLVWQGDCNIIDTCCGTGEILNYFAEGNAIYNDKVNVVTYGVEIDKYRGEIAEETLNEVIVAPIESCIISNDAFDFAYLNPPYDFALANREGKAERKEYLELERVLRYLAPGGVLIYVIPHYRYADEKIARMLATNFNKVSVARFTDENYSDYKQVMFIGHKKKSTYKEFNEKLYNAFINFANEDYIFKLPTLADLAERAANDVSKRWTVPAANKGIKTFQTRLINKSKIGKAFSENQSIERFVNAQKPLTVDLDGKEPPLPLASGQIALLLASGGINGVMGKGDMMHAVRGQETVSTIITEEHYETGTAVTSRTKREIAVKVILPSGEIKKLM